MELVFLHRDVEGSSALMEVVVERIRTMSAYFSGNAEGLVNRVWELYAKKSPALGLWVGLDDQHRVMGHVLATIDVWDGRTVVWLTQVHSDCPVSLTIRYQVLQALMNWAKEWNAKQTNDTLKVDTVMMASSRMTDAWTRLGGFEPKRVIYERRLI